MYPDNQQPSPNNQQAYSIDYLDQIAPKNNRSNGPKKIIFIIAGGVLFLLVILILGLIFSSGSKSSQQTAVDLYGRIETIKTVAKEQQPKLRDNVLRNYNSALTLQLTNASGDLKSALESEGLKITESSVSKTPELQALLNELNTEFEEAELNLQLDRTYAREMTYQLDVISSMMTAITEKTNNPLIEKFIDNNQSNLNAIADNFNAFDGTK